MIVPEISPTAGESGDGFFDSIVLETLLTGAFETMERCSNPAVYRLDRGNGSLIIDDTVNATSGVTNQFKPFGTSGTFTNGDEFFVACENGEGVQAALFKVDTAASHNAVLRVYDSTDGEWAMNELAITDEGNAFKTTGWHYFLIPDNANRQAWRPSSDPELNMPSKRYFRVRLDGVVGGSTPPQLSEIVLIRNTFRYDDDTDRVNGDTAIAPAAHKHYPWTGSEKVWCFADPAFRMEVYMHLIQTNVITDIHEYLASDDTWKSLSGWSNQSSDFTAGPAVLGNPVQKLPIAWSIPTDWTSKSQTLALDDGTTVNKTGYWIRERTTGVTSYGEHNIPLYRLRVRQFGNANTTGETVFTAQTLRGLNILSMTEKNITSMQCEVVNLSTGKASSFTVPANPTLPYSIDIADLSFVAGDKRGSRCISGAAKAVQIDYVY